VWKFVYFVNSNGTVASADLGNSSNYSNELQYAKETTRTLFFQRS